MAPLPTSPRAADRDPRIGYRQLLSVLASRAHRLGSRDAEAAAQEALRRSLADARSRPAVEYYFCAGLDAGEPEWALEQLLAWLHGVLRFVVREESARASSRREIGGRDADVLEVHDPAPNQLERLIAEQAQAIARECLSALDADHRRVLTLRASGLKYAEIARRLGVNENTVATWVRRGLMAATRRLRERIDRAPLAALHEQQE